MCPEDSSFVTELNGFCVKAERKCPISYMTVSQKNPHRNQLTKGPRISETEFIFYSEGNSNFSSLLPIAQLKVSEGGVCLNNDQISITKGRRDTQFLREEREECEELDQSFIMKVKDGIVTPCSTQSESKSCLDSTKFLTSKSLTTR